MSDAVVPQYGSVETFCKENSGDPQRFTDIVGKFTEIYGEAPEVFGRAPGRVNLIGEHIDYMDYSVLPMAIRQDTIVAIRRGGDVLSVASTDLDKYPTQRFQCDPKQAVDTDAHSWANYFLAAFKEVFALLESRGTAPAPVGLQVLVQGQVPPGSGLSSSAAFSCASALAVLAVVGAVETVTKGEVAALTTRSERLVGVSCGGMDQAASMFGRAGLALHVKFHGGLGVEYVRLPAAPGVGGTFVVMNSLALAIKAESAAKRYNLRVVECRLAAMLLLKALGHPPARCAAVRTLLEVQEAAGRAGPAEMAALVDEHLQQRPYLFNELLIDLGVCSLEELFPADEDAARVLRLTRTENYGFALHKRAKHVFSEAARVEAFRDVCAAGAVEGKVAVQLEELGRLMEASHRSCAEDYQCSCPELDELVSLSLASGALGARLTGAGWGGCAVALVQDEQVAAFLEKLREGYFRQRIQQGVISEAQLDEVLFATKPSSGAAVICRHTP